MTSTLPRLLLKSGHDRRIKKGHRWVYSNEVDTNRSPLTQFAPGTLATVTSAQGKPLGSALVNPNTLIAARLYSREGDVVIDEEMLTRRLEAALRLRRQLFASDHHRWVYGDSDALPGLVLDCYGEVVVGQISSAGMEQLKPMLETAIAAVYAPATLIWRNQGGFRTIEGLDEYIDVASGELPQQLEVIENGAQFVAPAQGGQKTGWFYDHRLNRARLATHARARRVLDLYSYVGGWGIQAALAGARSVTCVDSSAHALEWVGENARRSGVAERVTTEQGDAVDFLKACRDSRRQFDLILLDPPSLIPRRKFHTQGLKNYHQINQLALKLLSDEGILITSSCSSHLQPAELWEVVVSAARHDGRHVQVLEQGHQGPDHPIHPSMPETQYLKSLTVRAC